MPDMQQAGRLAMRVEGNLWVAYFAQVGTIDGAIFLGSIQMAFVQNPDRTRAFMGLMQQPRSRRSWARAFTANAIAPNFST